MSIRFMPLALVAGLAAGAAANEPSSDAVDFASGPEGWSINGFNTVSPTGGNPAERIHWDDFVDTFGIAARNNTSPAFLGDYTLKGPARLSIDVQVDNINFFGTPVPRDLVVILYDDDGFGGAPPAQVWANLGTLNGNGMPWTTFSADVVDVLSDTLPAGWNGAGDEDPVTFEPILPAGRTWTNVLAGVDRIEFTTFVPGFFFGFTRFDLSIDNVSIAPQEPQAWTDEGNALAGTTGDPVLTGCGTLAEGTANVLALSNAAPAATAAIVFGTANASVPFKGGTLVPALGFLIPVATSPTGTLDLPFEMPAGTPGGIELWIQFGIQDAGAVKGVALSNAVLGVTP